MKHSIKNQFSLVLILLIACTIFVCWILNNTLLESYYLNNKQGVLISAYERMNAASNAGNTNTNEFQVEVQRICGIYNISLLVINANSQPVTSSVQETNILSQELIDHIFGRSENTKILRQSEKYTIQNSVDPRTGSRYIELWGFLDNGNPFIIRSMMEGIQDSANIANRFLAYIGLLAIVISAIIGQVLANKLTKPILQLADVSKSMTNLDFEVKYTGEEQNEIGVLGKHMNIMADTLEHTISELKTANNELKRDIERKEAVDEMRKEFLSNVSHELKTPLALIMGYAEGLKLDVNEDSDSRESYCDVIMDEAQKMDVLVKKLLTLNHIEFGNDIVTMERFDIVEMIRNYLTTAGILISQGEANIIFEYNQPIWVWGDEFKVEEVFANYFTNALNHLAKERKIIITITEENGKVKVTVYNSGDPIPQEAIPHLWEKFYKVDKARTREYGGSGIGLSIVKAIMDSMNGRYGVENKEFGVEFWFELEGK